MKVAELLTERKIREDARKRGEDKPDVTLQEIAEATVDEKSGIRFVVTNLELSAKAVASLSADAMQELGRDMEIVVCPPWEYMQKLFNAASDESVAEMKKELTATKGALTKAQHKIEALEAKIAELEIPNTDADADTPGAENVEVQ